MIWDEKNYIFIIIFAWWSKSCCEICSTLRMNARLYVENVDASDKTTYPCYQSYNWYVSMFTTSSSLFF